MSNTKSPVEMLRLAQIYAPASAWWHLLRLGHQGKSFTLLSCEADIGQLQAHPHTWGNKAIPSIPPSLEPLLALMRGQIPTSVPSDNRTTINQDDGLLSTSETKILPSIANPDIGIVVSLEYDAFFRGQGDNWRTGWYARLIQVCQWTLMVRYLLSTRQLADVESS